MPFATRKNTRIHYTSHGEPGAPGVVLIQGLALSSKFWFDVPDSLLTDGPRHVLAIDNRGTGKSDRPRPPWTMSTMAEDVIAVMDHANMKDAIVVGISMGGMIAQHVALRHPSRVRGLALLATTPGFVVSRLPQPAALYRLLSLPFGGPRAGTNLTRLLLPPSKWSRGREIFRDWPKAMREDPAPPSTFAAHLFAASTHITAPRLKSLRCPTIVATGDSDALVPPGNARKLVKLIPNAELELVPDTGHAIFAEDRDLVRRIVARLEQTK